MGRGQRERLREAENIGQTVKTWGRRKNHIGEKRDEERESSVVHSIWT